jgi:prolipoprotein diacylglyceryltransferase
VPTALIALDFDPLLHLVGGLVVRWEAVAIAAVIIAALIVAGLMARRASLRADDLIFIAVGVVPGAVIGGRIGYGLLHLDYYATQGAALLDPGRGGFELSLAVVGGVVSGLIVATLLEVPVGRWMHLAVLPVLFVLGAGKLAMLLGGAGQGQPAAMPWATSFLGQGPWASLLPALPSHPAQAYEGFATLALALILGVVLVLRSGGTARDGRILLGALALWALVRAAVTLSWRDPAVVSVLNAGTLIALGVAVGFALAFAAVVARGRRDARVADTSGDPLPSWPDPADRPGDEPSSGGAAGQDVRRAGGPDGVS